MSKCQDLTGQEFGRLTVVNRAENKYGRTRWNCICDCENIHIVSSCNLKSLHIQSCGCLRKETIKEISKRTITPIIRSKIKESNGTVGGTRVTALIAEKQKNNTSGARGVCYDKNRNKYKAYIKFKKKQYNLGRYNTLQEAIIVRKKAEEMLFEPFLEWYNENIKISNAKQS